MSADRDIRKKHWPGDWLPPHKLPSHLGKETKTAPDELDRVNQWMQAMVEWGKNVRDDIIRLESSTKIGLGDPGDPPPAPWRKGG